MANNTFTLAELRSGVELGDHASAPRYRLVPVQPRYDAENLYNELRRHLESQYSGITISDDADSLLADACSAIANDEANTV